MSARKGISWLLHFVFPLVTSVILIYSLYASFVPVGIWLLVGIFILVWMRLSGNESWLSKAADIIEEREESQAVESK